MATDDQFCNPDAARRVTYEFCMFEFLCERLEQDYKESDTFTPGNTTFVGTGFGDEEVKETSALLESLLIHSRVLLSFFCDKCRRYPDGILATDFIPEWEVESPGEYLGDKERKSRLNKAVAHLSLKRVDYESHEKKWNLTEINSEVGGLIRKFLESLPADREPWFCS